MNTEELPDDDFHQRWNVPSEKWNSWKWQLKNSITTYNQLKEHIKLNPEEEDYFKQDISLLPFRITPYFLNLLIQNPLSPLRKTVIPSVAELNKDESEKADPLNEEKFSPVPGLVHRYPDRVLFLISQQCSVYCRMCTRSRIFHQEKQNCYQAALNYIQEHTEIRDVLLSGGDPLLLSDSKLESILSDIRKIPHVEIVRIGTKVPVVLPQRITKGLLKTLRKFHPLYINIHFAHPDELTPECQAACNKLADIGIPLGSQTILLKDINDDVDIMRNLFCGLLKQRVRPYYLYQCDQIIGSRHFRTSIKKGIEIVGGLRGYITGLAVPQFVVDCPGGGGKVPIYPQYIQNISDKGITLRNYKGEEYCYQELEQDVII